MKKQLLQMMIYSKRKTMVLLFYSLLSTALLHAQGIANYTFSSNTSGSLDAMTGASTTAGSGTMVAGYNDDNYSGVFPMGFTFIFMGTSYTHFSANSNGQMQLHTSSSATQIGSNVTPTAGFAILAPMQGDNSTLGAVTYLLTGVAPNRIFKVMYPGFAIQYGSTNPNGDMQVWLYENGNIEFVYGTMACDATSRTRSVFISSSNTATTVMSVAVGTTPTATVGSTLVVNTFPQGNITGLYSATQGNRRVFTFTSPPPCTGAPSAQPTALTFPQILSTQESLSFTAASPAASQYLIVRYPTGATPTNPVDAVSYNAGQALGSGTVVTTTSATTAVAANLVPGTTYDYYVYSAAICATGPQYNTSSPLMATSTASAPIAFTTTAAGGPWSATTTWASGAIPSVYDTVIVASGATLTVDVASTAGKVILNNNATVYMTANLIDSTDLVIGTGATFNSLFGTVGRTVTVIGNINNSGTLNMNVPGAVLALLGRTSGAVAQTISGSGTFSLIPTLTINNTAGVVLNNNLTVGQNLNLTNGILSGTGTLRLGNASFNNVFTMTSTGGKVDCPVASGLAGVATVNYNYNASSPIASYTTGNELSITAPNLNVTLAAVTGGNIILGTNATVNNVTFNDSMIVDAPYTLTVNGNAAFTAAPIVGGSGTYTMGANGTITTANLAGITLSSATGSIQTALRNYRATGNYTYNGLAAQVTGDGLPTTLTAGTVTSSTTGGLTLSQITTFNNLTLTTNFITNGFDLTVNGIANLGVLQITGTGGFTAGANSRILLNNTHASGVIQIGATNGNFLNTGVKTFTPGCDIVLGGTVAATGDGFPTSGIDSLVLNQTSAVTLTAATSANTVYITSTGRLTTTSANVLTVLGTNSTNVVRSSTGYIDGPLARTIAPGATGGYLFPLGNGATGGLSVELLNPVVTSSNVVLTAVVQNQSSGGTTGTGLTALNTNRYWAFAPVGGTGTLASVSNIRLFETNVAGVGLAKKVGLSKGSASTGAYNAIGGLIDSNSFSIMSSLAIPTFATISDSTYLVMGAGPTSGGALAGGTYTVGPTGTYTSLTSAIAAINERTSLTGPVILEFQATYNPNVETYPIVFSATLPTNATNKLTIRPSAAVAAPINFSGYTVNSLPLFDFNGGKNIIIDGRPAGTGTNRYISINQLQSGSGYPAVRFVNDAQNNVLRRLNLSSLNNTLNTSGVVFFSGTNAGTAAGNGNNNDTLDYCYIDGKSVSPNCIYANGAGAPADNKNVVISNCNMYDFFINAASEIFAIKINGGNTGWTVSGNNFYQTVPRNATVFPGYNPAINIGALQISNTAGNGFNIINNTIGGNISGIPGSTFVIGDSTVSTASSLGVMRPFDISSVGSTVPTLIMGNTISNITYYASSNQAECFVGIAVYAGACNIINNTIGSSTGNDAIKIFYRGTAGPAAIQGYRHNASGGGSIVGNIFGSVTAEVQGVQATGFAHIQGMTLSSTTFTAPVTIASNTIGSTTTANSVRGSANSVNPVAITGIIDNGATGAAITITGNTIANLASFSSTISTNNFTRGIFVTGGSSVSTNITGNTIRNLSTAGLNNNGDVSSTVVGIADNKSGTGTQWIAGNTIHSLISTNAINYANNIVGIYYSSTNTAANSRIEMNTIHSLQTASANNLATQQGIAFSGSTRTGIYNNMIRLGLDVAGASITGSNLITGINKTGGIVSAFHNSVYIGGTAVASGTVNTYAFNRTSSAADSVFNNIFVNARSNASGTGAHYAISLNNNTTFAANNNLYFTSGTGGVLGTVAAANQATIGAWKTASNADQYSFSADPAFIAPTGSATTVDLHISASAPTAIEGAGAILTGTAVLTDFDGQDRSTLTPVDVGADGGNFILNDVVPPAIAYTALPNSLIASNTFSNILISDASGVNTTAGTKPRIYFKKKTEDNAYTGNTNANNGWKYVEASNTSSPFSFTLNYALLNSAIAVGDTIQYFVAAQDLAGTVHVAINNGTFAADPATVALTAAAFPVSGNINSFRIMGGVSGTLTVGVSVSADYPTLTQAINDINSKIITAPVILELIDPVYTSPAETFPIRIMANSGSSPTNTLTIRPAAGVTAQIIDSVTNAIVDLNGIDYLILDGRPAGTGTPKSLSIINRSVSNVQYQQGFGNATPNNIPNAVRFINDATNNKLKHIKMLGACGTEVSGVVFFSIGQVVGNSDNLIDSCDIGNAPGIATMPRTLFVGQGSVDQAAKYNKNVTISNCNIFNYHSPDGESNAFKISKGNTAWTITGNHFYQTDPRNATGGTHYLMNLNRRVDYTVTGHPDDISGNASNSLCNMVITNNYVGGSAPFAAGTPWTLTGAGNNFSGIYMEFGNIGSSRVSGNVFTNFSLTQTSTGDRWRAFWIVKGFINVDSNIIGSETTRDAIVLNTSVSSAGILAIQANPGTDFTPAGAWSISGNKIGGIAVNGGASISGYITGIIVNATNSNIHTYNIRNNTIGSTLDSNIVVRGGSNSTTVQNIIAISNTSAANMNIRNNTIRNICNTYTGTGAGLTHAISSTNGVDSITGNTITNIVSATPQTNGTPAPNASTSVMGIYMAPSTAGNVCINNTIKNLVNTNAGSVNVSVAGINANNMTASEIYSNTISNLTVASTGTGAVIAGINQIGGSFRVANNMISLGLDTTDAPLTNTPVIVGLYKNSTGTLAAYNNSVLINGANTGSGLANTYAFRRASTGVDTLKNNIFINQRGNAAAGGGHYAVGLNNNTTLVSNNNLFHVVGPLSVGDSLIVSGTTGPAYTTLLDWQTASSQDANSKDSAVAFVSATNLHLDPSMYGALTLKGTPIVGINRDRDGDLRTITPYMGADEIASAPLPVTLLSFKANLIKDDVLVTWNTASEVNNKGFYVERSLTGKGNWEAIGFVNGKGNSNSVTNYQYNDVNPFTAKTTALYYRLRQVDMDGKATLSEIVLVNKNSKQVSAVSAYPNPFNSTSVSLQFVSEGDYTATVEVMDITGKAVVSLNKQIVTGNNVVTVEGTERLQSGIYFLTIDINGEKQTLKLIKQ